MSTDPTRFVNICLSFIAKKLLERMIVAGGLVKEDVVLSEE